MGSVLIIDDDRNVCRSLNSFLAGHGLVVSAKRDMFSGIQAAVQETFDLVILEIMLAGSDGWNALRRLRESSNIGIVVLSGRATELDRINAFDAGADDYLSKPCNPLELLGRIKAILRRSTGAASFAGSGEFNSRQVGTFQLNSATCDVQYMGSALRLTEIEFRILQALIESAGTVMKRDQIAACVFRRDLHPLDRRLDMHISRLRRKLDKIGCPIDPIKTIRSSGYLFASPVSVSGLAAR